jgi:hypothetical protein
VAPRSEPQEESETRSCADSEGEGGRDRGRESKRETHGQRVMHVDGDRGENGEGGGGGERSLDRDAVKDENERRSEERMGRREGERGEEGGRRCDVTDGIDEGSTVAAHMHALGGGGGEGAVAAATGLVAGATGPGTGVVDTLNGHGRYKHRNRCNRGRDWAEALLHVAAKGSRYGVLRGRDLRVNTVDASWGQVCLLGLLGLGVKG